MAMVADQVTLQTETSTSSDRPDHAHWLGVDFVLHCTAVYVLGELMPRVHR